MKNKPLLRTVSVLFALAFAAALILTLAMESSHDCTGSDCDLCKTAAICRSIIRIFFIAYLLSAAAFASRACLCVTVGSAYFFAGTDPVRLKVKLLN